MRILVTGSKGFIGKHLVAKLKDHEVFGVDLDDEIPDLDFDGVIHLAAVSRVSAGEANPAACVQANIGLTAVVLQKARLSSCWFVFMGTQEQGDNYYGLTKRFAEQYAKKFCEQFGIPLTVIRPPVVWGRGDHPDKVTPKIRAAAVLSEPITLDDKSIRLAHVEDVVDAIYTRMGLVGEFDVPWDEIRLKSLHKLMEYVAHPH